MNGIAKNKGWSLTDVARLALDEYAVAMKKRIKKSRSKK
jgi:hypothetical protein